jgi:hypothetical protein
MRTRLAAIVALLWVANLVTTSAMVCAGWQGTPVAHAACCKAAGHHCPQQGQDTPDQCCAKSEARHQSATITALTALVKPVEMTTVILDLLASQAQSAHAAAVARSFEASTLTIPHDSPHLVFSVFRI